MTQTREQLKQTAAAIIAHADGKPVELEGSDGKWIALNEVVLRDRGIMYFASDFPLRPKPEPVTRPWSAPADVPLNCWVRVRGSLSMSFIIGLTKDYVIVASCQSNEHDPKYPWTVIQQNEWEWSIDRINWHPCTVTEP